MGELAIANYRGDEIGIVVKTLELGADDYLKKAYEPAELTARIKAVMRIFPVLPLNLEQRIKCYAPIKAI